MATKRKQFTDELRDAIVSADMTRYRLAKKTGLTEGLLSRFVNGHCGLSTDSIDLIAEVLDLHVASKPKKAKQKGR